MAEVRIVLIGAGSAGFTTATLADLLLSWEFEGSAVTLVDIDEARLEGIWRLA